MKAHKAGQDSDAFDWQKFPSHPLSASPTPYRLASSPDPRVEVLLTKLSGADSWDNFMEMNGTQAFIVIQDGKILYENYYNDTQRDSIVTSFSVAKSFGSALIGNAIEEGYIYSVDDPIATYLPELAERDPKFNEITIRHLLLMASGLEYTEMRPLLFNSDDPLTTYFLDQRKLALENTKIIDPPILGMMNQVGTMKPNHAEVELALVGSRLVALDTGRAFRATAQHEGKDHGHQAYDPPALPHGRGR